MGNYRQKLIAAALTAFVLFLGCGSDSSSGKKDILIQINNSKILLEEFNDLIKIDAYTDPEMELTDETRDQFIEYLIRKELMIQEAARLKLDSKNDFIRTIEKYWEATLIRNLLDLKSAELKKKVLITEDEIEAYYVKNKDELGHPFEEVRDRIKSILESKKMESELEAWTLSLKETADITVNKALINGK